jgi:2-succinyl-5-enolpyruvyl-6-hydroxy-3-cyclohexene-1-carboxylate synthase
VHLNVPITEPLAPDPAPDDVTASNPVAREGRPGGKPLTAVPPPVSEPSDELIATFAELVSDSRRGVILAGRQRDPELGATVAALARACGYPVLAEPISQLRCGTHDRELVVPAYDLVFRDLPKALEPELVIRVGDMVTSKAVRTWLGDHPGCRQVVIDPDGAWNEPTSTADLIARADPVALLSAFADQLTPDADHGWEESWLAASEAAEAAVDSFLDALGDELFEPRVHRDLCALLAPRSTVFVASSMPVRDLETFLPSSDRELRFLANRGANGIDGMVSSGLGAAAAAAGPTYIVTGDLGLYHDMNGLLAVRRLGVEAIVVVMNNRGGGIFDFLPIARHRDGYEELFGTPTGLDLGKVADLYGMAFTTVSSYADLPGALSRPGLVEIPLDRPRNVQLHRELFERASASVHATVEPSKA